MKNNNFIDKWKRFASLTTKKQHLKKNFCTIYIKFPRNIKSRNFQNKKFK